MSNNPRDQIEPAARDLLDKISAGGAGGMTVVEAFALSQAISLKRIADALHGTLESTGLLQYVDEISRQGRGH